MANYLTTDSTTGGSQEVEGLATSAGVADAGKIIQTDATGQIDPTLLPNIDSVTATSGEALLAGDLVYIDSAGEVVKASAASGGNEAIGFVLDAVPTATSVTVYFEGRNTGLSALTVGTRYFLSDTTAGAVTDTAPTDTNELVQFVGRAISATTISFEPAQPIKRA